MTGSTTTALAALAAGPSPLWYATRASGTVSLVLFTAVTALGAAAGGRYAPRRIARFEVSALHRNLSLISLAFLGLHLLTTVADTYTDIGLTATVVPFVSSYRPLWVGLGAVALDLLLAVAVSSALRHRLGHRRWKAVHWLAYAAWPVALLHGIGTGTDTRLGPQQLLYAGCLLTVLAAAGWRLGRAGRLPGAARRTRRQAVAAPAPVPVAPTAPASPVPLRTGPATPHHPGRPWPEIPESPGGPGGPGAPERTGGTREARRDIREIGEIRERGEAA
ncbi:ferric reductase-like transmembrane domain-containing protein [Streptomyces zingiberis]|uniref:ferric reductase-like transmembrane domain-containing protein n=1 Tax=Streptomyces zingiberis TaxID=2053010 RepID=UPI0019D2B1B7|nr:ferric reductase-like transmembrane domain-containing protein [Streptomyces zingiberis]